MKGGGARVVRAPRGCRTNSEARRMGRCLNCLKAGKTGAKFCPRCGHKVPELERSPLVVWGVVAGVLVLAVVTFFWARPSTRASASVGARPASAAPAAAHH